MKGLTTMKRHRHSPEQVVRKLREGERLLNDGKDLTEVLRHLEISEASWNRWRNQCGGMKATEARRLRELEVENGRLKKLLAEAAGQGDAQGAGRGRSYRSRRGRKGGVVGSQGPEDLASEVPSSPSASRGRSPGRSPPSWRRRLAGPDRRVGPSTPPWRATWGRSSSVRVGW